MKYPALLLLAAFCTLNAASAENNDSVCFYYVLQNPKIYGAEARSWFEIDGLKDKAAMEKINHTLKQSYYQYTDFQEGSDATMRTDEAPPGYTDFVFFNGNTYGNGYARFKDSDSLLRLKKADGYYGSGKNLNDFYSFIAPGKMANLHINCITRDFNYDHRHLELTFSLTDGRLLPNAFVVPVNTAKKDSLMQLLDKMAEESLSQDDKAVHHCKMIPTEQLADSCRIPAQSIIKWYNGDNNGGPAVYGRAYRFECDPGSGTRAYSGGITFHGMRQFLFTQDLDKLEGIYR